MITLLKKKKPLYVVECAKCGAIFQFSADDIYVYDTNNGRDYFGKFDVVSCPECKEQLTIHTDNLDEYRIQQAKPIFPLGG